MRGMIERGYTAEFAARLFEQIKGFGSYGFPESHAASFAGIVYASCWLKCHEPAAFACALLNAQPMGFYGPSQIVQDAHATASRCARSTCVTATGIARWRMMRAASDQPAIRLGLRQVRGFRQDVAERLSRGARRCALSSTWRTCARAPASTAASRNCWPRPARCAGWPVIGIGRSGRWPGSSRSCRCSGAPVRRRKPSCCPRPRSRKTCSPTMRARASAWVRIRCS